MNKRKKNACLVLFSVSLLASQGMVGPILWAEENIESEQVAEQEILPEKKIQPEESLVEKEATVLDSSESNPILTASENEETLLLDEPTNDSYTELEGSGSEEKETPSIDEMRENDETPTSIVKYEEDQDSVSIPEESDETPPIGIEEEIEVEAKPEEPSSETEQQPEEASDKNSVSYEEPELDPRPEETKEDQDKSTLPGRTQPEEKQSTVATTPSARPALTETFFDGARHRYLPESFRASEVAESSLLGFTLPLLSDYKAAWQGAVVYEMIRQIGDVSEEESFDQWVDPLITAIVGEEAQWAILEDQTFEALQPGDLLVDPLTESESDSSFYLGQNYHVHLDGDQETEEAVVAIKRLSLEGKVTIKRLNQVKLTPYGEELITAYPASFEFTINPNTKVFIDQLAQEAQRLGQEYDVFASVLLAQAILESGSGSSSLASSPHYNLFGIKGSHQGKSVILPTMEDKGNGELYEIQSAFRSYGSYKSSMEDYIQLIRGGITGDPTFYQEVWRSEAKNYLRAADALTGSYATDVNYHKKLNSLIAVYELTQYDQAISQGTETGIFIQGVEQIPEEYRTLMHFPTYNGRDYNHSGSYPVGQCTWYVFNRVHQLGGQVDEYMGNGGDWGATGRRLGYQISQTPKAGSMISFSPGTAGSDARYGHVAFVEAVGPNGILISEGNVYGGTTISYRVISNELALSNHVTYIFPN